MDTDDLAQIPAEDRLDIGTPQESGIQRQPDPNQSEAEKAAVTRWCARVAADKQHWDKSFKRMRANQKFAYGDQWAGDTNNDKEVKPEDRKYVANITLRHVQQRVAALYAKNPKAVAKRREMLLNTVWDGSQQALQIAEMKHQAMQQVLPMAAQALQVGDMGALTKLVQMGIQNMDASNEAMAVLQDADNVRKANAQLDRVAKTLELFYAYNLAEQAHPFKGMMKLTVRRAITNCVGYVKLGFQRAMERDPDKDAQISDATQQLTVMQRRAADLKDREVTEDHPEIAQLKDQIVALERDADIIVREGLVLDYPGSTSIIPHAACSQLREFLGADWVTQEYLLTPDEIKEIYGKDIGTRHTRYEIDGHLDAMDAAQREMAAREAARQDGQDSKIEEQTGKACVWEIYSKTDGLVYHVCDGYPEYLRPPAAPEVYLERFWPWFPLVFNECVHDDAIFPPSDVDLIRDMQMEMNRSRQSLREHRFANRPKHVAARGMLSDEDKGKLHSHPENALIELDGLQPGQKVEELLQGYRGVPIDPNLYEVSSIYEDTLRVTGNQEANLGGVSGATATETQVAETSRMTSLGSNIDDLDDLLNAIAHSAGQILLLEVSEETVKQVIGPGAVWPQMTKADVAKDLYLEIEAGSTGRPSKQLEVQNAERLFPILMQVPGVSPEWMAREIIRRMDDKTDLTEAFSQGVPSIMAMNAMKGMVGGPAGAAGQGQGPQGGANAPQPPKPGGAPGGPSISGAHGDPS